MRIISWNIKILRDLNKYDKIRAFFKDYFTDIALLQETKINRRIFVFIEDWVVIILDIGHVYL